MEVLQQKRQTPARTRTPNSCGQHFRQMCTRIWKIATGLMITTALEEASECLKQSKILNQFISMAHSKERTNITHTATSYILFDSKELWEELPSEEIHR
jgi:hypothetical protein